MITDLTKQLATQLFRASFQAKHAMTKAHTHEMRATFNGMVQGLHRAAGIIAEQLEGSLDDSTVFQLEQLHNDIFLQEGRADPLKALYVEQLPDEIGGFDLTEIKKALRQTKHRHRHQ
jgi:hypothetical protein